MMKATMILVLALSLTLASAQTLPEGCNAGALASCLSFLQDQSAVPDDRCCTNLRQVNSDSPSCLCAFASMAGGASGLNINVTRALELPARCNIPNVDASTCSSSPFPSPTMPPAPEAGAGSPPGSAAASLSSASWLVVAATGIAGYVSLVSRY